MSTYIIAAPTRHTEQVASDLRDPLFPAIFTDHRAAEHFLDSIDEDGEIARLNAMQLLRLMIRVYEQGNHYLLVNPQSPWPAQGQPVAELAIEQQLARFAELLTRDVVACNEKHRQDRQATR